MDEDPRAVTEFEERDEEAGAPASHQDPEVVLITNQRAREAQGEAAKRGDDLESTISDEILPPPNGRMAAALRENSNNDEEVTASRMEGQATVVETGGRLEPTNGAQGETAGQRSNIEAIIPEEILPPQDGRITAALREDPEFNDEVTASRMAGQATAAETGACRESTNYAQGEAAKRGGDLESTIPDEILPLSDGRVDPECDEEVMASRIEGQVTVAETGIRLESTNYTQGEAAKGGADLESTFPDEIPPLPDDRLAVALREDPDHDEEVAASRMEGQPTATATGVHLESTNDQDATGTMDRLILPSTSVLDPVAGAAQDAEDPQQASRQQPLPGAVWVLPPQQCTSPPSPPSPPLQLSAPSVIEAWPVDESERPNDYTVGQVVHAVDVTAVEEEGWAKKHLNHIVAGFLLAFIAMAVALGLSIGSRDSGPLISPQSSTSHMPSIEPSASALPSLKRSASPSASPVLRTESSGLRLLPYDDMEPYESEGSTVAIHGNTAVVGAPSNDISRGAAFVFARDANGTWSQVAKLQDPDGEEWDLFGMSVAIDEDTIVVGSPLAGDKRDYTGAAHVFARNGSAWTYQEKLLAADAEVGDVFGWDVAVYGNTVVVGGALARNIGAAYIFRKGESAWVLESKLDAPNAVSGDYFGSSVGIYQETLVVGAHGETNNGTRSGSVHVYVRDGSSWMYSAKLLAPDGAAGDAFGGSIVIFGDHVLVGARDAVRVDNGAAYVYAKNETAWSFQAKFLPPDGATDDRFGHSVGIYDDTIIIGASLDDDDGTNSGSSHIYVRQGEDWRYHARLSSPDGAAGDEFGYSVAIHNGTALIDSSQGVERKAFVFSV